MRVVSVFPLDEFRLALKKVYGAAAPKGPFTALSQATLFFSRNSCTIACCNLNQWCQATIPAQGDEFSLTLYDKAPGFSHGECQTNIMEEWNMKQLGNLSIVCAKRPDVLMQVYGGRVSVHVGEGPERARMDAAWDDDKMIQLIIRELNFGRYAAPSRGKAA